MEQRIFAQEWRDCLREQFKYVVRQNDQKTLPTLKGVMYEVGFTEDDLKQMYVEATMRADDMPDDFVPDVGALVQPDAPPAAVSVPSSVVKSAPDEPAIEPDEDAPPDEPPPKSDPGVQQLSLF